jgi:hypothetical protein
LTFAHYSDNLESDVGQPFRAAAGLLPASARRSAGVERTLAIHQTIGGVGVTI